MESPAQKSPLNRLSVFIGFTFFFILPGQSLSQQDASDLIYQGDQAFQQKNYVAAEKLFTEAMARGTENYRILFSLAKAKNQLKKYEEAIQLAERILAMPLSRGAAVLVYRKGESEPEEAEVVDETVIIAPNVSDQQEDTEASQFLKAPITHPIPHYRLFFKKSGKIRLVPKMEVTLKYLGVPPRTHEKVKEFLTQVKKKIIVSSGTEPVKSEMVPLKGGCFMMGSDKGDYDERPVHEVCLSPFWIDKYEVAQSNFEAKMGNNPSRFVGPRLPVDRVNWHEAKAYCEKSGKRLPTEAEWEYAARGGTQTEFYVGDHITGKFGNFCDRECLRNSRIAAVSDGFKFTAPVGSYSPNPFGLYDMAGNVAEWVEDWMGYSYYRSSPKNDPKGPTPQDIKVMRGGGWLNNPGFLRSANRTGLWPEFRNEGVGFRCAKDSAPEP